MAEMLKKGRTYSTGYRDALVLDTFRNYAFCEVTGQGMKFYDICTAVPDIGGRIRLEESRQNVGIHVTIPGSAGVPLSRQAVEQKWTDFIVSIGAKEAREREAQASQKKREDDAAERKQQYINAKEAQTRAAEELRRIAGSMDAKRFVNDKGARTLMLDYLLAQFYNNK